MVMVVMAVHFLLKRGERLLGTAGVAGLQILTDLLKRLRERAAALGGRRLRERGIGFLCRRQIARVHCIGQLRKILPKQRRIGILRWCDRGRGNRGNRHDMAPAGQTVPCSRVIPHEYSGPRLVSKGLRPVSAFDRSDV